jgi:lipopolysaccharide transport system ATP-binding protein
LNGVGITFTGRKQSHGQAGLLAKLLRRQRADAYCVHALQNVNIEIRGGERVGLIGLNGAGKSTLLKVMARIYPPHAGRAVIEGHVCPMFDFATGFEMDLSGWDNIRVRGLLLGMQNDEIEGKLPEIGEFTGLGEFLDHPVRTYSTGMFVRLAFAVSTSVKPEILLLDEVIGAGDAAFADKAKNRMRSFMEQGKMLVLSSHNLSLLSEFCNRTIWLERGHVKADGSTPDVVDAYLKHTNQSNQ